MQRTENMRRTTLLGGAGGIAFSVLTFIALFLGSPVGGSYKASDATSYVASDHRAAVFISAYIVLVGVLGLICLLVRLREAIGGEQAAVSSIFWGSGLLAAAAFAVGWLITFTPPMAYAYAGNGFCISPTPIYAITQNGGILVYGDVRVLL